MGTSVAGLDFLPWVGIPADPSFRRWRGILRRMDLVSHPPQIAWANTWPFRDREVAGGSWSESDHLIAVLDGNVILRVGDRRVRLATGDALAVPWGASVHYSCPDGRLTVVSVHLVRTPWDAALPGMPLHGLPPGSHPGPRPLAGFDLPTDPIVRGSVPGLIDLMLAAAEAWGAAGEHRAGRLRGIALCLVTALLTDGGRREDGISALITWLGFNYGRSISREELAQRAGMGQTALGRRFRERTGRSPMDYILHLRMAEARRLVEHTDMPMAQVASFVGIADPAYFSRVFAQAFGVPPGRLRRDRSESRGAGRSGPP